MGKASQKSDYRLDDETETKCFIVACAREGASFSLRSKENFGRAKKSINEKKRLNPLYKRKPVYAFFKQPSSFNVGVMEMNPES